MADYVCAFCHYMTSSRRHADAVTPPQAPFVCPVCYGKGTVPTGFYFQFGSGSSPSTVPEPCRTCDSTGIVWR